MRQGGSSFNDRCVPGGISEVQLRGAKARFDICPTLASTLDETDSLQTLLSLASQPAGRLSPIVITLGRALCGRVRGLKALVLSPLINPCFRGGSKNTFNTVRQSLLSAISSSFFTLKPAA